MKSFPESTRGKRILRVKYFSSGLVKAIGGKKNALIRGHLYMLYLTPRSTGRTYPLTLAQSNGFNDLTCRGHHPDQVDTICQIANCILLVWQRIK